MKQQTTTTTRALGLKRLGMATLMTAALALSSVASAAPGEHLREAMSQLDLTPAQRTDIRDVMTSSREDRAQTRAELQEIGDQFREELRGDSPNARTLHTLVDRRAAIQQTLAHDRVENLIAVHAVLTPDQRDELAQLMADAHRGPRGRGPSGDRTRGGDGPRDGAPPRGGWRR